MTKAFRWQSVRWACAWLLLVGVVSAEEKPKKEAYPTFGSIKRLDPRFDELIPKEAKLEKVAEGFDWSEGPTWVPQANSLLFSDIPPNRVMQWKAGSHEATVLLDSAGYSGKKDRGGEPGSNGLTLDSKGRLILCEHGDRRVARIDNFDAVLAGKEKPKKTTLADRYNGKRFNSPNDLVYMSNGDLYFTDPPYGLAGGAEDPARELDFCGVYRLSTDGKVTLLTKEMSRPNGITLSPDEKTLYVANSDPEKAIWMAFPVKDDGTLGKGREFYDVTDKVGEQHGLPDGLKVDNAGNLFATAPGGVMVFSPDGTHLGTIETGEATANCNWGDDGSTLYITADMYLARVKTSTQGKPVRAMGDASASASSGKLKVLFLCTGNSCRSQMAEGWARALKGDQFEVYSAGVDPHGLNPNAVRAMKEAGIDITSQTSKHVNDLKDVKFDYVVTVCANAAESCPVFPGETKVVHRPFDDPPRLAKSAKNEQEASAQYARVRDEIREFVETLPASLTVQ